MNPEHYDSWYHTPRGNWIGSCELELLVEAIDAKSGESILDTGCGTGYFSRRLATSLNRSVTGIDICSARIGFASRQSSNSNDFLIGDALALPFSEASFDLVVSMAAVCFMDDEAVALREMVRVARRRIAVGLFNRHSLLFFARGRSGGRGGYRGAHWHTAREVKELFYELPVKNLRLLSAIQLPGGGWIARQVEKIWPAPLLTGGILLAVADVDRDSTGQ
ncbi:MAG: class I SAM-dependent methyltransferase [Gammaproteobacteria bacterium]|nr:class I SAM-dependent methyltransferase [Pseudomonadales bacterium]